jgi:hypothetical protein
MGRIDRLEITDFKSYAGTQVIGPFKNFSAVIGPNGAGAFGARRAGARARAHALRRGAPRRLAPLTPPPLPSPPSPQASRT